MKKNEGSAGNRRRWYWYAAAVLVVCVLAVGISSAVRTRFAASSPASSSQWQPDGLSGDTVHYLAIGHGHTPLAFAATESGVYRRGADGTWTRVLTQSGMWTVALLSDNRTVIAGDQAGKVDLSLDAGAHWSAAQVASQAVYAVSFVGGTRATILAGAGGGLYRSVDGGSQWQLRLPLRDSAIAAFTPLPGSPRVIFAGAVASSAVGATGVYVSRDAGLTWHAYGRHLQSGGGIMALAVGRGHRLLAGTMGHAVWTVAGVAAPWARTASGMPTVNDHVAGIAVVAGPPDTIYAGTLGSGVFESRDGGKTWSNMSVGLRGSADAMIVLSLAYDSSHHVLYAGTSTGVYRLTASIPATAAPA